MFRLLLATLRSRLVWLTLGVLTVAGTAFWLAVAAVAAVIWVAAGAPSGWAPDGDELARAGAPVGLAAAGAAVAGVAMIARAVRRHRTRRWMPLYETMRRDAATVPATYLARVASSPSSAVGGQIIAVDLTTGVRGSLWLPGPPYPRGSMLCFTTTPVGPQVRGWMTAQLWQACTREAARVGRRIVQAEHDRRDVAERRFREAADRVVADADQILREHAQG